MAKSIHDLWHVRQGVASAQNSVCPVAPDRQRAAVFMPTNVRVLRKTQLGRLMLAHQQETIDHWGAENYPSSSGG